MTTSIHHSNLWECTGSSRRSKGPTMGTFTDCHRPAPTPLACLPYREVCQKPWAELRAWDGVGTCRTLSSTYLPRGQTHSCAKVIGRLAPRGGAEGGRELCPHVHRGYAATRSGDAKYSSCIFWATCRHRQGKEGCWEEACLSNHEGSDKGTEDSADCVRLCPPAKPGAVSLSHCKCGVGPWR